MDNSTHANTVFPYGKTTFAMGLFWQALAKPRELKKEALSSNDLPAIMKGRRQDIMDAVRSLADDKLIYHEAQGRKRVWRVFNDVQ